MTKSAAQGVSAAVLVRDKAGAITWDDVTECPQCHALVRDAASNMAQHQQRAHPAAR